MKKWLWVIPTAVIFLVAVSLIWVLATDWTTTVGICYREPSNAQNRQQRQQLEDALTQLGYEVITVDCDQDQAKQLQQIPELIDRTCELLIIEPVMVSATEELMNALQTAAVPAILIDRAPDTDLNKAANIIYVGHDITLPGAMQVQMIHTLPDRGDLNGDGVISCLILQGPQDDMDALTYAETEKKALKLSPLSVDILDVSYGEWTKESGKNRCAASLRSYGKDIEVIFCGNSALTLGAVDAIAEVGRQAGRDIYLVGIGGEQALLQAVQEGSVTATVQADQSKKVQTIVDAVQKMMAGEPVEGYSYLEYLTVTAE